MVQENNWPLLGSLWGPSVIFIVVGVLLLIRTAQERPLPGSGAAALFYDGLSAIFYRKKDRS
jgi:hypothetical protein